MKYSSILFILVIIGQYHCLNNPSSIESIAPMKNELTWFRKEKLTNKVNSIIDDNFDFFEQAHTSLVCAFSADIQASHLEKIEKLNVNTLQFFIDYSATSKLFNNNALHRQIVTNTIAFNLCLRDDKDLWISNASSLKKGNQSLTISLIIAQLSEPLLNKIHHVFAMYESQISGRARKQNSFINRFQTEKDSFSFQFGPEEKPLTAISTSIATQNNNVTLFISSLQKTNSNINIDLTSLLKSTKRKNQLPHSYTTKNIINTMPLPSTTNALTDIGAKFTPYINSFTNIFLLNSNEVQSKKIILFLGSLSKKSSYNEDSILLEFSDKTSLLFFEELFVGLRQSSQNYQFTPTDILLDNSKSVVISEVMWMGSIKNDLTNYASDEMIELYNNSSKEINLGNWQLICLKDVNRPPKRFVTFPLTTIIKAHSTFVISKRNTHAFIGANLTSSNLSISNKSTECILTDGDDSQFHYGTQNIKGTIVDKIGNQLPFDKLAGINDLKKNQRASMKRISLLEDGSILSNWTTTNQTNINNDLLNTQFSLHTFATPGRL